MTALTPFKNYTILIIAGLAAAALSLYFFLGQSIRLDEAQSLWASSHSIPFAAQFSAANFDSPLYLFLLQVFGFFFGTNIIGARILSFLFFAASVAMLYFLGRRAYDWRHGILAATLFAISPFMNWYANEARMYSLFALVVIINQYFFVTLLKRQSRAAWIGYTLTALCGCYVHYFFFLGMLAQAVFLVVWRKSFPHVSLSAFLTSSCIVAAAFLPWFFYMVANGNAAAIAASQNVSSVTVFNTFSSFLFGFNSDHLNTIIISFWPLSVLLAFLSLRNNRLQNPLSVFFILYILVPVAGLFIISSVVEPVFLSRYLILTLPSLYLFLSSIIFSYPKKLSVALQIVLILATFLFLIFEATDAQTPVKENYQQASLYLQENAGSSDIIAVSNPFSVFPLEYYYHGQATVATIPTWNIYQDTKPQPFSSAALQSQADGFKENYQRLWLLLSHDDGHQQEIKRYYDTHFEKIYERTFSQNLTMYVYKLNY